jgi:hypothetical protein
MRPEFYWKPCPLKIRGRREDRMRAAPAVSRACLQTRMCTRAYRFSWQHQAFPAQWLYGLYVIVLVTGFLATIVREKRLLLTHVTPAPGRRTHTTSPYAADAFVSRTAASIAPRALRPDDREAPLLWAGMRGVLALICPTAQRESFRADGLTHIWGDLPVG